MNLEQLHTKAATDRNFRDNLIADPVSTLRAAGMTVRDGVTVTVLESTTERAYVALPPFLGDELTEDQLSAASGGCIVTFF
jgi:hypothetical protein